MNLDLSTINWVGVIVAAVVNMVIGFVWYSPALFAKQWTKLTGKTDMKGGQVGYLVSAVGSLVTAFVLAWVMSATGTTTLVGGVVVGLLLGVGFVATSSASNYIFEGRPRDLYLINVGYSVVSLAVMGAALTFF